MEAKNLDCIAHVKFNADEQWETHSLEEHLQGVSALAGQFADKFSAKEWGELAGVWHDLGKYRPAFQAYIRKASGYDSEAHIENRAGRVDHSTSGAVHAIETLSNGVGQILAYIISGHHTGLPDWNTAEQGNAALVSRVERSKKECHLQEAQPAACPDILKKSLSKINRIPGDGDGLHLWVRMIFSCLVDADFLDTEQFMSPAEAEMRSSWPTIQELKIKFDKYMMEKSSSAKKTPVNAIRATVLADSRASAQKQPGAFTLSVPTGGGKTLSGMAFALDHAVQHNKERVIVVVPYTSIIEQTAEQYREVFGDAVIEHHSNLDPSRENAKSRLAAENWDAPVVVTTNVQFFESLFSAKPSRCRKLHNVCNSVVIIDEAQMLPPDFLQPVFDILRLLVEHYGVSLVLSTATQPLVASIKDSFGQTVLRGLNDVQEIVTDVNQLYQSLERVEVVKPNDMTHRREWADLAKEILQHDSVLVIVNSRKDCRELHRMMPRGTIHLSALMCGEHRSSVISKIKELLRKGKPVRVISTQLVEAGVDLDFPVVYRALAGLDSIAQAAGRCNREGLLEKGKVYVFVPPKAAPKGMLTFGEQATRNVWHGLQDGLLSHQVFPQYFAQYFNQIDPDKFRIIDALTQDARSLQVQFRSAAEKFSIIDDKMTRQLIVPYKKEDKGEGKDESERLIALLERGIFDRQLLRKVQRYSVSVYNNQFEEMQKIGAIRQVSLDLDLWAVCVTNAYSQELGLLVGDEIYCSDAASCLM